jgi:hypothetical protein
MPVCIITTVDVVERHRSVRDNDHGSPSPEPRAEREVAFHVG